MNQNTSTTTDLTLKTKEVIGRDKEIKRLNQYIQARGDNNFVYYWADGGLGKTRLLEELQKMVKAAGPDFHFSGIIDLYHTDTHSTSDVERTIVDGLDPDKKYFAQYRQERDLFEKLRERGAYPTVLEQRRKKLSRLFIDDFRVMAKDVRKLVICFDTVELLQYESSIVEERAGLDKIDTRLKPWLLNNLKELRNVLVVFAGRPQKQPPGEITDLQKRFVNSLYEAFENNLTVVELPPFSLNETKLLIDELSNGVHLVPDDYLPIIHRLTRGRPIFIHLLVDLIMFLALEPGEVFKMFDEYKHLVDAPDDDKALTDAIERIEEKILHALFYETGDKGEYLLNIALMPKGVEPDILYTAIGMPRDQAQALLSELEYLSFTKKYTAPAGSEKLHGDRLFLHDEMYRLLKKVKPAHRIRIHETQIANTLIKNFYEPILSQLESEIQSLPVESKERTNYRERQQKLQVERLYYKLVQDPRIGYIEYKYLSDLASRNRWVGFSMRLLDEFLRFYNDEDRRNLFEQYGLSKEQIIRESTQLWVERFRWWARYQDVIKFASDVLNNPGVFFIDPDQNSDSLGIICALWAHAQGVLYRYVPSAVDKALTILSRLPKLEDCSPQQALARARLSYGIAYNLSNAGILSEAATYYADAIVAFRRLGHQYAGELAILLHTLAYLYAKQGRMVLAQPLAYEALRINEMLGSKYSTGLTLSTLCLISRMRGNYSKAIEYGEEALTLFREIEDPHGTILSQLGIGQAQRRNAKNEIEKGRKLSEARQILEETRDSLKEIEELAQKSGLELHLPNVRAELGRVHRELGRVTMITDGLQQSIPEFNESIKLLQQVTKYEGWGKADRANALQDLADAYFFSGNLANANDRLSEVESLIGKEYLLTPDNSISNALSLEYFSPLGKVELLRGQIAFKRHDPLEGLKHYVYAYIYFSRFSSESVEKETMIEYLYGHLNDLPEEVKRKTLNSTKEWIQKGDWLIDLDDFVQALEDLLGF